MAKNWTQSDYTDLEQLIDRVGLNGVLKGMTDICYEKQEHVESNGRGRAWTKAAKKLYALSTKSEMKLP